MLNFRNNNMDESIPEFLKHGNILAMPNYNNFLYLNEDICILY